MELNGQTQLIHMFVNWKQIITLLGLNLTAGNDRYDTYLFYMFLSHISSSLLQHLLHVSIQVEEILCCLENSIKT